jgi:hypothetical protein
MPDDPLDQPGDEDVEFSKSHSKHTDTTVDNVASASASKASDQREENNSMLLRLLEINLFYIQISNSSAVWFDLVSIASTAFITILISSE